MIIKKYIISKTDGTPVDPAAEYFVLRLDLGQPDSNHRMASVAGILAYAEAIEPFIPSLAQDIKAKYGVR